MRFCAAVALASPFLLSACALHPIPEDVVRVSTKQIVEHIRCEIRDALNEYAYKQNGAVPPQFTALAVDEAVQEARKEDVFNVIRETREKVLNWLHNQAYVQTKSHIAQVRTADEFDKIIKLQGESEKIRCQVMGCKDRDREDKALAARMKDLIYKVYTNPKCVHDRFSSLMFPPPPTNNNRSYNLSRLTFNDLTTRRKNLDEKIDCLRAQHKYYQKKMTRSDAKQKCQSVRRSRMCGGVELRFDTADPDKLEKERLDQRVKLAEKALNDSFKSIVVGYGFEFTMTDSDASSIGLDFKLPFTNGTFDLGIALSENKTRANTRTFYLAEAVAHLLADTGICGEMRRANWRYPIAGEIGLAETVKAYWSLANMKGFFKNSEGEEEQGDKGKGKGKEAEGGEFSEEIEFTTELSGGPSPMLALNAVPNQFRLVKMTPKATRTRKDVHKLTLTFIKAEVKKTRPEESVYPAAIAKTFELLKEKRSLYILKQTIREELGVK